MYFVEKIEEKMQYVYFFENFEPNDKSSLIPLIQEVRKVYGYLPESALQEVSRFCSDVLNACLWCSYFL